jgi:hypothetical protein
MYLCASVVPLICSGCWTITPPPKASIKDPVPVFVADYGEHSSVLLPQSPGVYVEYSFGDWAYSVQNHDTILNALAALLISFQSSYGRTFTPMEKDEPYPFTARRPTSITRVDVSAAKVAIVAKELDDRYQRDKWPPQYNSENQAFFVKDPKHYWVGDNCNHLTQKILRELGCESKGLVFIADFKVEPQK